MDIFSRTCVYRLLSPVGLVQLRGLRPWPSLVNPIFAYFGRNFFIGHSIFRRKKSFAMSSMQVNFQDILPETSKSSAFWDMGGDSHVKWLLLFSPDVARASWTAPV